MFYVDFIAILLFFFFFVYLLINFVTKKNTNTKLYYNKCVKYIKWFSLSILVLHVEFCFGNVTKHETLMF